MALESGWVLALPCVPLRTLPTQRFPGPDDQHREAEVSSMAGQWGVCAHPRTMGGTGRKTWMSLEDAE